MNSAPVDTPGRLLLDLKKLLALQQDFGIEEYPSSPELEQFLNSSPSLSEHKSKAPSAVPAPTISPAAQKKSPPPPRSSQTLADIQAELGDCRHCPVHETRKQIVFGAGSAKAALFIVGDCPSPEDAMAGRPFSGAAGELLAKMLKAIGLGFDDAYLTTIVKCQAADHGAPSPDQIKSCLPFLLRQLDAVGPTVVCAMGELAAQTLLRSKTPLIRLRGSFHDCHGIPLMPTFHPAFLLKNQEMKRATWIDLQLIQAKLGLVKG